VTPTDDAAGGDVSWLNRRNAPDLLCHSVRILPVDFFGGELYIDHGGLNLAMSHELHQRGQADAVAQHVPSEGMSKSCGLALDRSVMRR